MRLTFCSSSTAVILHSRSVFEGERKPSLKYASAPLDGVLYTHKHAHNHTLDHTHHEQ